MPRDRPCVRCFLPEVAEGPAADAVSRIDVLWLSRASGRAGAAFEVEHAASICSGIVRMLDLSPRAP